MQPLRAGRRHGASWGERACLLHLLPQVCRGVWVQVGLLPLRSPDKVSRCIAFLLKEPARWCAAKSQCGSQLGLRLSQLTCEGQQAYFSSP